jgi:ACS family hexuronate transporter-like MFS transporter
MAGSVGGFLLATFTGYILQWTGSYASLFALAAAAYLAALTIMVLLAPGLRKVEPLA